MTDDFSHREMISQPSDRRTRGTLARHTSAMVNGYKVTGSVVWTNVHPDSFDAPEVFGQYPKGFLPWALRALGVSPLDVLHVCSGALGADVGGVRVDIRPEVRPDVVANGCALPFAPEAFGAVLIDPPYTVEYADGLYGTSYPRPSHLLAEASRVARPDAPIGFLHYLVPMPPPNCTLERVHGIYTGVGYRIRAWTVFRKHQQDLFSENSV